MMGSCFTFFTYKVTSMSHLPCYNFYKYIKYIACVTSYTVVSFLVVFILLDMPYFP